MACSEGLVFNGFSRADGSGGVRALSLEEGEVIWAKSLEKVVHNAPAVSKKLYGHESKELFVVIGMGEPTGRPLPIPANISGKVLALEGLTGNQIWSFEPPPWHHHGAAGSTWDQLCFPDLFSAATIDATGAHVCTGSTLQSFKDKIRCHLALKAFALLALHASAQTCQENSQRKSLTYQAECIALLFPF